MWALENTSKWWVSRYVKIFHVACWTHSLDISYEVLGGGEGEELKKRKFLKQRWIFAQFPGKGFVLGSIQLMDTEDNTAIVKLYIEKPQPFA